jgi:hypothetical protein
MERERFEMENRREASRQQVEQQRLAWERENAEKKGNWLEKIRIRKKSHALL